MQNTGDVLKILHTLSNITCRFESTNLFKPNIPIGTKYSSPKPRMEIEDLFIGFHELSSLVRPPEFHRSGAS